jgi:hypothetical protein
MTTPYEKPYPKYIVTPPADLGDGIFTVPQLQKRHDADQEAVNSAAEATGTSKFTGA